MVSTTPIKSNKSNKGEKSKVSGRDLSTPTETSTTILSRSSVFGQQLMQDEAFIRLKQGDLSRRCSWVTGEEVHVDASGQHKTLTSQVCPCLCLSLCLTLCLRLCLCLSL